MTEFILDNIELLLKSPKILYVIGIVFTINGLTTITKHIVSNLFGKIITWIKLTLTMLYPALYSALFSIVYVSVIQIENDVKILPYWFMYTLIFYSLSIIFYDVFYDKFKKMVGKKDD